MFNPSGYCGAQNTIFHHGKKMETTNNTAAKAINNEDVMDSLLPVLSFKLTTPFIGFIGNGGGYQSEN